MKDLISREKALDCFHDWVDKYGDVHTADEMTEYQAIEALPVIEQGWIPVEEELPELEKDVLISIECAFPEKTYEVFKASRTKDGRSGRAYWWIPEFGTVPDTEVTAWMELPEPYKGDK